MIEQPGQDHVDWARSQVDETPTSSPSSHRTRQVRRH